MKIEEKSDENLCARLFNFFFSLLSHSESEEEASENMIKFSAFIFGSRPPRKIAFEKRKIHLDHWCSTLDGELLRCSPRLTPNVVPAHSLDGPLARLSHVAQQRLGRVLANEQSARKIVDIARAGVKKHFTWFELLAMRELGGKRKTRAVFINFPL